MYTSDGLSVSKVYYDSRVHYTPCLIADLSSVMQRRFDVWDWNSLKFAWNTYMSLICIIIYPDSKIHAANMGPTWVLSSPGEPHVGPMNLAIWVYI